MSITRNPSCRDSPWLDNSKNMKYLDCWFQTRGQDFARNRSKSAKNSSKSTIKNITCSWWTTWIKSSWVTFRKFKCMWSYPVSTTPAFLWKISTVSSLLPWTWKSPLITYLSQITTLILIIREILKLRIVRLGYHRQKPKKIQIKIRAKTTSQYQYNKNNKLCWPISSRPLIITNIENTKAWISVKKSQFKR